MILGVALSTFGVAFAFMPLEQQSPHNADEPVSIRGSGDGGDSAQARASSIGEAMNSPFVQPGPCCVRSV